MDTPVSEFNFTRLERVLFGPGKVESLGNELERRGLSRAVVVTGKTLGQSPLLAKVTDSLGTRCAAVFAGARQHVPGSAVRDLVAEIERTGADAVVSFGGGSPIDTAKVASYALLTGWDPMTHQQDNTRASRELVHIAIPTTLSAGEYTPFAGITEESTRTKDGVGDPRLQPRTVINDPTLTLETPDWLWVSTAMRSLDHAVESAYSIKHQPISDTLATKAIELLVAHLPASIHSGSADQLAHRGHCQTAAWFSIFGASNTRFGLSHALGHKIGPKWDVPHGVTSCITLPHAMRFMAEIAPQRFGPIAAGFGLPFHPDYALSAALECADQTARFIAQFNVPHRLRDAGVSHDEIGQIAGAVVKELEKSQVVDRPVTEADVLAILEAAY